MTSKMKQPLPETDVDPDTIERDDAIIGVALRWSLIVFGGMAVIAGAAAYFLWPKPQASVAKQTKLAPVALGTKSDANMPRVKFTDVTREAGIRFVHENGAIGKKLLPETMGGGCAFFDFDGDGDQDLLLVNSLRRWPWDRKPTDPREATMALYRNDGKGKFDDVTAGSGLDVSFYGMGAAVGDYDGDGRVDVFLSALGKNHLFHNEGRGKFRDVTSQAGVAGDDKEWSTSSGWVDYDNDGDLDLFVCNYLKWSREYDESQDFQLTGGGRAYGRPQNFEGTFPYLYRNEGNGRFTEVAEAAGMHIRNPATGVPTAKSLGVVFTDVDQDGWLDFIVANDTVQNFLFHNQGNGKFTEIGAQTGIAFDMNGNARGAMGIDVARFRDNDAIGVVVANFANEMTALYVSYGKEMQFMDEAISTGIGPSSRLELKFGIFYADYDLDSRLDLFTANGHLEQDINRVQPSQHYEQSPQLFWNCGFKQDTEFLPVPADYSGPDFAKPMVGRGAAYADIDGDGDLDILLTAAGQPPRLLRNDQQQGHHWLRFRLAGTRTNRDAIGACVEVELADGRKLRREVLPTRSYLSQVELPVTFGLGSADEVRKVAVCWPDGSKQEVAVTAVNRSYDVAEAATKPRTQVRQAAPPAPQRKATSAEEPKRIKTSTSNAAQFRISDFGLTSASSVESRINSFNPQSERSLSAAAGNPQSLASNHTSCGNYLDFSDRGSEQDGLPLPPPSGPSCSRDPAPQGMVPPVPRIFDPGQSTLLAANRADGAADRNSSSLSYELRFIKPPNEVRGIFRPPRSV
ncbi:MAG: FG-GAP-like repeat-containing protein [Pirellulales bacterium]